jgi:hypothetical protein
MSATGSKRIRFNRSMAIAAAFAHAVAAARRAHYRPSIREFRCRW